VRVEVVASLSQGRTAAAQCGLFTHKSVPVIFEPPCNRVGACREDSSGEQQMTGFSEFINEFLCSGIKSGYFLISQEFVNLCRNMHLLAGLYFQNFIGSDKKGRDCYNPNACSPWPTSNLLPCEQKAAVLTTRKPLSLMFCAIVGRVLISFAECNPYHIKSFACA